MDSERALSDRQACWRSDTHNFDLKIQETKSNIVKWYFKRSYQKNLQSESEKTRAFKVAMHDSIFLKTVAHLERIWDFPIGGILLVLENADVLLDLSPAASCRWSRL